jgi:Holliday junction resolvasome RuvABC ATP-dependent DNA helicase subunit
MNDKNIRELDGKKKDAELVWEKSLRPHSLDEFPGQEKVKEKFGILLNEEVKYVPWSENGSS